MKEAPEYRMTRKPSPRFVSIPAFRKFRHRIWLQAVPVYSVPDMVGISGSHGPRPAYSSLLCLASKKSDTCGRNSGTISILEFCSAHRPMSFVTDHSILKLLS